MIATEEIQIKEEAAAAVVPGLPCHRSVGQEERACMAEVKKSTHKISSTCSLAEAWAE